MNSISISISIYNNKKEEEKYMRFYEQYETKLTILKKSQNFTKNIQKRRIHINREMMTKKLVL